MFGGIDPKQMNAMMKKMGIKTTEIDAEEVLIKSEKNIIIKNPKITMMEIQGQKTFQIVGDVEEAEAETAKFTDDDVKIVMEKTEKSEDEAREALEKTDGDIAEAIILLS